MEKIMALYDEAEQNDIDVDFFDMETATSLSVPLPCGKCAIAINTDKIDTLNIHKVCLAHEMGHCMLHSFYNRFSSLDIRQKHENHADKWAINRLVPVDEFDAAIADGYDSIWSLAEHFGVTEDFMRKAVCFYIHGNLAVDMYL